MPDKKCPACESSAIVLYEPRLNNHRYWCLACSEVFKFYPECEEAPFTTVDPPAVYNSNRFLEPLDVFGKARILVERKVGKWLTALSTINLPKKDLEVVKKMLLYLDDEYAEFLIGHLEVNLRIIYTADAYSTCCIWLDPSGIRLKRAYYERDNCGDFIRQASFVLYPPPDRSSTENMIETLQDFWRSWQKTILQTPCLASVLYALDYDVVDVD